MNLIQGLLKLQTLRMCAHKNSSNKKRYRSVIGIGMSRYPITISCSGFSFMSLVVKNQSPTPLHSILMRPNIIVKIEISRRNFRPILLKYNEESIFTKDRNPSNISFFAIFVALLASQ